MTVIAGYELYRNADSVFEFGLGESTRIAAAVGVPRYAGIDSDAAWVSNVRGDVPLHYRFYFADIGPTKDWGYPTKDVLKGELNYQMVPLIAEPEPFGVYMVDGRWRLGCVLLSFLHAKHEEPSTLRRKLCYTIAEIHEVETAGDRFDRATFEPII